VADDTRKTGAVDLAVHELAQHLQVIEIAISAIERHDGEGRHAQSLGAARRALARLETGLDALAALARGPEG